MASFLHLDLRKVKLEALLNDFLRCQSLDPIEPSYQELTISIDGL